MWIKQPKVTSLSAFFLIFLTITISNPAKAKPVTVDDAKNLYGLWLWTGTDIIVRVNSCSYNPEKICAIITNGEAEGSYILKSLYKKDKKIVGMMIHPKDGRSYDAEIKILSTGKVNISGCTAGRTNCQESVWKRQQK